jgi:death-on-curing protein
VAPTFLDLWDVVRIHQDQLGRYGGERGIRDAASLASAVAMPQAASEGGYLHGDLFEMAAAYLFHIVRNHPFLDGNKRTGVVAAIVFLRLNDVLVQADEDELEALVRDVAEGRAGKAESAEFFRRNVHHA